MSEFIQISGAVDGYIINRAGIVRNPAGRELKPFGINQVKIKVLNGQMRTVSIKQLVLRNFGDKSKDEIVSDAVTEVVCGVDNTPQLVEAREVIDDVVVDNLLSKFSLEELELEIKIRKEELYYSQLTLSKTILAFYKAGGTLSSVTQLAQELNKGGNDDIS